MLSGNEGLVERASALIPSVYRYLTGLQEKICDAVESQEDATFREDAWTREGGGGRTRLLVGTVFEQGGVNFSHVRGEALPVSASASRPELAGAPFEALGVSLVLHPRNPHVPTCHMNVRFFCATPLSPGEPIWWFGGGFDLTPYYGYEEDVRHWHRTARDACAPFGEEVYPRYKAWCDEYFFIPHRNEPRGVGGIFFDDLNEGGFERSFGLARAIGDAFLPAYLPILEKRKNAAFGDREREFQRLRRGRYVEFNLVYDRGTLFGLQSGGRVDSILMSLPPEVAWRYAWAPEAGTTEQEFYDRFLKPRNWV